MIETVLAQTFTAGADLADTSIMAGLASVLLGALVYLARWSGLRLLTPVVAAIEWFRSHGARSLDLSRSTLTAAQREEVRSLVQEWLWSSLRDVIAGFAHNLGLSAAFAARVTAITGPLKVAIKDGHAAPPETITETTDRVRKTTGVMAAFRATDDPPAPPRLGALILVAALLLGAASGCVSQAARDLAVAHEAHLIAFDGASVPHPSYLVDDAEPGPDGKKLTAAEKTAAWKAARMECLESARALREALK